MGLYIIEGIDGSGKSTQIAMLKNRLEKEGIKVLALKFPVYDDLSSGPVRMYLSGELGSDPNKINAYAASSFYAIDRFASFKKTWEKDYLDGTTIISDRYTISNIIHQSSKVPEDKRDAFVEWLYDYEHNKLGIPVPDRVFYLDVPPSITTRNVENRYEKNGGKKDIHENNIDYLEKCYKTGSYYCDKLNMFRVECVKNGKLKSVKEINNIIFNEIKNCIEKK